MSGQGQGRTQVEAIHVLADIRSVNNRHLKLQLRAPDALSSIESQIESLVRSRIRRGSVYLTVKLSGGGFGSGYAIQADVLESYIVQSRQIAAKLGLSEPLAIGDFLELPGVIGEGSEENSIRGLGAGVAAAALSAVELSIDCLNHMREAEGDHMRRELVGQLDAIHRQTEAIGNRAPLVIEDYRERLTGKLKRALEEIDHPTPPSEVVREVLLFAERADIREELVRLSSHTAQFASLLESATSQGRKLDFLTQEMFRETNTIGSKANDAEIAQRVVELKTIIEQIRELVQNVE